MFDVFDREPTEAMDLDLTGRMRIDVGEERAPRPGNVVQKA
jgi:hypothetical protein